MIREYLVPSLREKLPGQPFTFSDDPKFVARLSSPCSEVGELILSDDGDEATVYLSKITHRHFGCYEDLPEPRKDERIASVVTDFVADLVADRVILWRAFGGSVGGTYRLKPGEAPPRSSRFREKFVWSHQLPRRNV
jgi:hypothetical protein